MFYHNNLFIGKKISISYNESSSLSLAFQNLSKVSIGPSALPNPVNRIMDGSIVKHDRILGGFFQTLYGTIKGSRRNYQGIEL